MKRQILLVVPLSLVLAACATTGASSTGTTSNPVAGSNAVSAAGSRAIGAYGATGTSDDVRGRSGSSGASTLTGRANLAGSDLGTRDDATDTDDSDTDPPRN